MNVQVIFLVRSTARHTLRFWNHVIVGDNAHSFACVRLFPTGTQYPAGTSFNDFRVPEKTQKVAKFRRFQEGLLTKQTQ